MAQSGSGGGIGSATDAAFAWRVHYYVSGGPPHLISSGLSLEIVTRLPSPCRCRPEMPGSDACFIDDREFDRGSLPRLPPPGRPTSLNSHIEAFILSVPKGGGFPLPFAEILDEGMFPQDGISPLALSTTQRKKEGTVRVSVIIFPTDL